MWRRFCTFILLLCPWTLVAEELVPAIPEGVHPRDPRVVDMKTRPLMEFKSPAQAVSTRVSRSLDLENVQPGYLGIHLSTNALGQILIDAVEPKSPADQAGLKPGTLITQIGDLKFRDIQEIGTFLRAQAEGEELLVHFLQGEESRTTKVKLGATSRPMRPEGQGRTRVTLGIRTEEAEPGPRVSQVEPNSPAATSGIKVGDVILQIDSKTLSNSQSLQDLLTSKRDGETVSLMLRRGQEQIDLKVPVKVETIGTNRNFNAWDTRLNSLFKRDEYKLAVLIIQYPDVKLNPVITPWDWDQALFSQQTYNGKSPTGQQVYGSLSDYYREQSCGKLLVKGKVFDPITVARKREEYANDRNRFALLTETIDKLYARDGKSALDGFDGIFFIYAGARMAANRGGLYWPHRSTLSHQGKRWSYFICPEGGSRMDSISVTAHEFGHMLGLPDLYARPESPGSEGLGVWCAMSTGHGRDGKPMHFSAWCKEQMGWLKPTIIDPTVKQKLVLAPIGNHTNECFKVLIRPDGSEYLLLENRQKNTFDRDLPEGGLLIWRVVDGRPVLEESHGVAGPEGPNRYLTMVPYPSQSNNAFTPFTTPSSRSLKGGGLPVHITHITRHPDGRVSFLIGYEFH